MRLALIVAALSLPGACRDETVRAHGGDANLWHLQSIDGAPFVAQATLEFPAPGQIAGEAPCNSYSAQQTAPYPWFSAEKLTTTRRTCPDLAAETSFLRALEAMTLVEVAGAVLILSNDAGREMVFEAAQ
jgi:heat shock protein HslJ